MAADNTQSKQSLLKHIDEGDYSLYGSDVSTLSDDEFPYKQGDKFPTKEIKNRAAAYKRNKRLYNNDVESCINIMLQPIPEIDPMTGFRVREIVTKFPLLHNSVEYWTSILAGNKASISTNKPELNSLIRKIDFDSLIKSISRERFLAPSLCLRLVKAGDKHKVSIVTPRNFEIFYAPGTDILSAILVFNIVKKRDGREICEMVLSRENGTIDKRTFEYNDGTLGKCIDETVVENEASDTMMFTCQYNPDTAYGSDTITGWVPAYCAVILAAQNMMRLSERCREMLRKVPKSALSKDEFTGATMFFNKGTVSYDDFANDGKSPDIAYITPNIPMDECIKAYDKAIKQYASDTALPIAFYDIEKMGSNLSAKSIESTMVNTKTLQKIYMRDLRELIVALVKRFGALLGLSDVKVDITWESGIVSDESTEIEDIYKCLGSSAVQTITLAKAISRINDCDAETAREIANKILAEKQSLTETADDCYDTAGDNIESVDITSHGEDSAEGKQTETPDASLSASDDAMFENELPFGVTNVSV